MKLQTRVIYVGIACAYALAAFGAPERSLFLLLAIGYLLIAVVSYPVENR